MFSFVIDTNKKYNYTKKSLIFCHSDLPFHRRTQMKTEVLLSSVVTLPRLEPAFRLAKSLNFHGLELMPYRWTSRERIADLVLKYHIPIKGIHFPFWWKTKSLWRVIKSESEVREKIFAIIWWIIFGPGHSNCQAALLGKVFSKAYLLFHPDAYLQIHHLPDFLLTGRRVYFENERPKKGEPRETYNPFAIKSRLTGFSPNYKVYDGHLMLDPGHLQLAQQQGFLDPRPIEHVYSELKPEGFHLSFSGHRRFHDLPTDEEWKKMTAAIKTNPSQYLVVELKPGLKLSKTYETLKMVREMIRRDIGI